MQPCTANCQALLFFIYIKYHFPLGAHSPRCPPKCPGHRRISVNKKHRPNVGQMLCHRLRRWLNIDQTLGRCLVFAGIHLNFMSVYTSVTSTHTRAALRIWAHHFFIVARKATRNGPKSLHFHPL